MGLNLISYLMGDHYQLRRRQRYQGKSKSTLLPRTRDDGEMNYRKGLLMVDHELRTLLVHKLWKARGG
jgi:hypothetical protein